MQVTLLLFIFYFITYLKVLNLSKFLSIMVGPGMTIIPLINNKLLKTFSLNKIVYILNIGNP